MLVVLRKEAESIRIGDDVVVTVVRVGHSAIRLGIAAPRGTSIQRGEIRLPATEAPAGKGPIAAAPAVAPPACELPHGLPEGPPLRSRVRRRPR